MILATHRVPIVRHNRLVVCIPCYNEERWLAKTLEAVLQQTDRDFAVLISDNGSNDGTAAIAERYVARNPRFHLHRHVSNIGAAENFNFTRDVTESPFLMWLGAHDLIEPTYVEQTLPPLIADPSISLSYAYSRMIDEDGATIRAPDGSEIDYPAATGERKLGNFPRGPVLRYLHVVRCGDFCIPVNNIIRRSALAGIRVQPVRGCDAVILSHLAFKGPFYCVRQSLYLHRIFKVREQSYMTRITGAQGVVSDWRDFREYSVNHFSQLIGPHPLRPLYAWIIRTMFSYYHSADSPGLLPAAMRRLGALKAALALAWRKRRRAK